MNEEIKQEWVRRLRSGEYAQGQRYLRINDKYCCLGVLCDMATEAGVVNGAPGSPLVNTVCYVNVNDPWDFNSQMLPYAVTDWAGIESVNAKNPGVSISPELKPDNDLGLHPEKMPEFYPAHTSLAQLNDLGYSFSQIADVIEEQL